MYEPRDNVAVLKVEVVMATKDVGGNHTGKHAAVLFVVRPEATKTSNETLESTVTMAHVRSVVIEDKC